MTTTDTDTADLVLGEARGAIGNTGAPELRLGAYKGPLDLLLQLARAQRVDLAQLSITRYPSSAAWQSVRRPSAWRTGWNSARNSSARCSAAAWPSRCLARCRRPTLPNCCGPA